jgi:hypothetical protein
MSTAVLAPPAPAVAFAEALAFEAPYLIEKLLKDHTAESLDEARLLFRETKRYFVITHSDRSVSWSMYSLGVDAVWHQFVLFTREYIRYSNAYFGGYIQHAPSNAPRLEHEPQRSTLSTFQMFADRYEQIFGEPLADVWFDDRKVTLRSRLLLGQPDGLSLLDDEDAMVNLLDASGNSIFAVDTIARPALEFILATGHFFVRELPGALDDDQRVALVSTLVENRILSPAT